MQPGRLSRQVEGGSRGGELQPTGHCRTGDQARFAGLDDSFVGILGLSHVGALAYLAAPHAKTSG